MSTVETQALTCPCCGTSFETSVLTGPNKFAGQTSEFRRHALGLDPLPYLIAICPVCGFADLIGTFATAEITAEVRALINDELRPVMRNGVPMPSSRYAFAALVAAWQHKPDVMIGNLYMRAAWCADDANTDAAPYRLAAIGHFVSAVDAPNPPENRLTLVYLIGELYRRVGEADSARQWFDRAIADASAATEPAAARIVALATQQRDDPHDDL